tara:strand:- start:58 stop:471 length:414 start_codon:yes stop_codon:yes gene_type:complete
MNLNKLTKKELVEHGKSLGLSLDIKAKKEVLIDVINKPEGNKAETKKDSLWVRIFVAIALPLLILGTIRYIWFPTLVFFKNEILFVLIIFAYLGIGSWIESKISPETNPNYTLTIGGILFTCFIVWGISWSIQNPYG